MTPADLFGAAPAKPSPAQSADAIYAHCDGGARGNPGPAGYGAVITSANGAKLAELSEYLGHRTNNYAEYSGLLGVLAWALENGRSHVRLVSDSELMVKQIQGKYKVNSPDLRPLFDEAKRRIARLGSFQITHALRHKNKDADRLANEAMDRGTGRSAATGVPVLSAPHERRAATLPASRPTLQATSAPQTESDAVPIARPSTASSTTHAASGEMLRGFVRDGTVHLLGGKTLPDGIFVKIVQE